MSDDKPSWPRMATLVLKSPWDPRIRISVFDVTEYMRASQPLYMFKLSKSVWNKKEGRHTDSNFYTEKDVFYLEDLIHQLKEKLRFAHTPAFGMGSRNKLVEMASPDAGSYDRDKHGIRIFKDTVMDEDAADGKRGEDKDVAGGEGE